MDRMVNDMATEESENLNPSQDEEDEEEIPMTAQQVRCNSFRVEWFIFDQYRFWCSCWRIFNGHG